MKKGLKGNLQRFPREGDFMLDLKALAGDDQREKKVKGLLQADGRPRNSPESVGRNKQFSTNSIWSACVQVQDGTVTTTATTTLVITISYRVLALLTAGSTHLLPQKFLQLP